MQQHTEAFANSSSQSGDVMPFSPGILMDIIPGSRAACCHCKSNPCWCPESSQCNGSLKIWQANICNNTPFYPESFMWQSGSLFNLIPLLSLILAMLAPACNVTFYFPTSNCFKRLSRKAQPCLASPSAKQQVLFQALSACGLQVCILRPYFRKVSGKRPFLSYWRCLRDSLILIQLSCQGLSRLFSLECEGDLNLGGR